MNINTNDFALVLSPREVDNKWTGEVDINIKYDDSNEYSEEDKDAIVNLMTLMSTCVDMMENDSEMLQKVFKHRDALEEGNVKEELLALDMLESKVDRAPKIVETVGNVIKLNWGAN
tara:strand:+ start:96 stop:446 length:351 start_codon:yes stop_codon:yes gene_type:complete